MVTLNNKICDEEGGGGYSGDDDDDTDDDDDDEGDIVICFQWISHNQRNHGAHSFWLRA